MAFKELKPFTIVQPALATLYNNGVIRLNYKCLGCFKNVERVKLLYDADAKMLALQPVENGHKNGDKNGDRGYNEGYRINIKKSMATITARSARNQVGAAWPKQPTRFKPVRDEKSGAIVINLKEPVDV